MEINLIEFFINLYDAINKKEIEEIKSSLAAILSFFDANHFLTVEMNNFKTQLNNLKMAIDGMKAPSTSNIKGLLSHIVVVSDQIIALLNGV